MARLHQLLLALVFLTRLPLGRFLPPHVLPLTHSAWAFPLAGAVVGGVGALPLLLDGPPLLLAALSVAAMVWFTGALHEDALADFSDAAGGKDRADRLRIMRDSRIGSFGTMALILATALRIAALAPLGPWALIAAAMAGRAAIVVVMLLPPARPDGLGRAAGRPGPASIAVAVGFALIALAACGPAGLIALPAAAAATALVAGLALRWLGGQSGDVLGTASVATETAVLVTLALLA